MPKGLVAEATIVIDAPRVAVWRALVDADTVRRYFFGTELITDWREGGPIAWRGVWQGRAYQDKGTVVAFEPPERMAYTHFSPLAGLPDEPDNYHTVTIRLAPDGAGTRVLLTQDNNANEEARAHSQANWETVLAGLKTVVEG